jgi:hypothetical protein
MIEFNVSRLAQSSILNVYMQRAEIELDPEYQRVSGIWTREKRQLLLDSLLNGYDVPKLYFHEFVPVKRKGGRQYRYAIIDGQQRLQTVWDFIDGNFSLAPDFEYMADKNVKAGGLTYAEIGEKYPRVKSLFDATWLDIISVRTNRIDLIEDMFSRLNEAVPLNAPEKRNALGGPLPSIIRTVATHRFFMSNVPFRDRRYRHRELATKFLYLEYRDGIVNTKKPDLDQFVKEFRRWREEGQAKASAQDVAALESRAKTALSRMAGTFGARDKLLRQVGMITLYYHLFRYVLKNKVEPVSRQQLQWFEGLREENRQRAEAQGEVGAKEVDTFLLEFDKHSQTPNDAYAIRIRLEILLRYLKKQFKTKYDSTVLKQVAP